MKYLLDFLQRDAEKSIIFPSLECSVDETKILKHLCSCYIDGVSTVSVFTVLCAVFGNKDYKFLEHLGDIKTLFELGYIVQNSSGFKGIEQKLKGGTLELLFVEIELSGLFLKLLEEGSLDEFELKIELYNDHLEYLQDQFYRIELFFRRLSSTSEKNKKRLNQRIKLASETIEKKLKISKIQINIEQIFKYNSLNEKEKIIFLALLKEEYGGDMEGSRDLNTLIGLVSDSEISRIKNRSLLDEGSNLVSSGLIDYDELIMPFGGVGRSFFITENILGEIIHPGDKKMTKKLRLENMVKDSEIFELIEPKTDIDDVVLNPKTKELFKNILRQLDRRVLSRLTSWGIKSRRGVDAKIIFYGPPGTGKTLSALSLAKSLKKLVLSFDCSKILSKYVGESEQNVRKIFDIYKEICSKNKIEPVLLLNEADQFLSTRIDGSVSGGEKMHNQMQNIFLEQIEKFEGVLIATTNFLESLDKAFSRRFDYKVEFKKPNFDERLAIWRKIMPENANFEENFDIKELAKFELSGAQIVLALKNTALKVAIRDDGIFTLKDFIVEIGREISGGFDEDAKKVGLL